MQEHISQIFHMHVYLNNTTGLVSEKV